MKARWTNLQVRRLKECFLSMSRSDLAAEFSPHPIRSIHAMANSLGLSKRKNWKAIAGQYKPIIFCVNRVPEMTIGAREA